MIRGLLFFFWRGGFGDAGEDGWQLVKPSESPKGRCLTRGELEIDDSRANSIGFTGTVPEEGGGPHQSFLGGG